jgi:NitT/TauT family transport system substrate-binding protein
MRRPALALALAAALAAAACGEGGEPDPPGTLVLRVGHFPNVTHAQGLVAHQLTRRGKGWFEERLGPGVRIEWFVFNAGPSAMEALLAGNLDLAYVGPNPALNAHVRTGGEEVRVLAGAARGGAALVVPGDGRVRGPADLRGRRVATPQLGNTQDVACRAWLLDAGLRVTPTGGDVTILPTQNPDQLPLFRKGDLDAVWTVEPWVTRLVDEAGGRVLVDDRDSLTTVLAASARLLRERGEVASRFVAAHRELTALLLSDGPGTRELAGAELLAETTRPVAPELLEKCWARIRWDAAIARADFEVFVASARRTGLLPGDPDLSRLVPEAR